MDGRAAGFSDAHPRYEIPGLIATNRCLRKLVTPVSWEFMHLHRHYANGILPFSGGLLDQPARYIDAMEIIDGQAAR